MHHPFLRSVLVVAGVSLVALALVEACTSDGGGVAPVGSTDGTSTTPEVDADAPSSPDPNKNDGAGGVCPPWDPADPYCSALHARCEECSASMRPCEIENLKVCAKTSLVFNEAARVASAKCLAPGCPAKGDEACLRKTLAEAPVSPAQQKLVNAFCATCNLDAGAGAPGCAERFFFRQTDGGPVPGPAGRVKLLNDALVAEIAKKCIPAIVDAGESCEGVLFICAAQIMGAAFPPSACADAGK